jgi:hypothetical protein
MSTSRSARTSSATLETNQGAPRTIRLSLDSFVARHTATAILELESPGDVNAVGLSIFYDPQILNITSMVKGIDAQAAIFVPNS